MKLGLLEVAVHGPGLQDAKEKRLNLLISLKKHQKNKAGCFGEVSMERKKDLVYFGRKIGVQSANNLIPIELYR